MGKSASVINRYMAAMADGPQGAPVAAGLLTEDFKFDGPMLQANNRAAFLEGMKMMGSMKPHFTMLKQFEDGQDVCSVYEMKLGGDSAPAVVMTEVSVVRDGLIASQRLMYDAEAMKSAMAK